MFQLKPYFAPDFTQERFVSAPNAVLAPAPFDGVAPEQYHAMSIFPEYFKIDGQWLLAEESRMDCVAVYENGRIFVREFRLLKKGDMVVVGRTENCEDGIFMHTDGFAEASGAKDAFAFRTGRSRETAFSRDYDELYELLRHDREHGKIVWVMGPAFSFDSDARKAMSKLCSPPRLWQKSEHQRASSRGRSQRPDPLPGEHSPARYGQNRSRNPDRASSSCCRRNSGRRVREAHPLEWN